MARHELWADRDHCANLVCSQTEEVQKGKFKWPGVHTQGSVLAVTTPEGRTVTLGRSEVGWGAPLLSPLSWPQFPHLENENKNLLPLRH